MELDVPLEARLRPSTLGVPARHHALDFVLRADCAPLHGVNRGPVPLDDADSYAGILVQDADQRLHLRAIVDRDGRRDHHVEPEYLPDTGGLTREDRKRPPEEIPRP